MTEEHETIEKQLAEKIHTIAEEYEPKTDNEVQEWFTYNNGEVLLDENKLLIEVNNQIYTYSDSED